MQVITNGKKRKIAIRLGFIWFWIKSLPLGDFAIATEILCQLCHDLDIEWEAVQRASTAMADSVERTRKMKENADGQSV